MSAKRARGTKRTCQNPECVSRFYDLHRDPIRCPLCGAAYLIPSAPESAWAREKQPSRKLVIPDLVDAEAAPEPDAAAEDGEALSDGVEVAVEPAAEVEEAVLEEDEDGDVSGILDGSVTEREQES